MHLRFARTTGGDRRDAEPAVVARAGHRHVQQAQVLLQAGALGQFMRLRHRIARAVGRTRQQFDLRPLLAAVEPITAGTAAGRLPRTGERHEDQRIFQAFGFVDGHHANQVGVAFQAHDMFVGARRMRVGQLLGEVADQRLFAVEVGCGLLQEFGDVQHIGQRAFAAIDGEQARRQVEDMQQPLQHGKHALPPPQLA